MKFRKKPVEIEAMRFDPDDPDALVVLLQWVQDNGGEFLLTVNESFEFAELEIRTLEDGKDGRAKHVASPGDWIIRGVQGEFYPCKPDIFDETYDAVA